MKIDKELEIKFLRAVQKIDSHRTNSEKESIKKRNELIDAQFEFTPQVCEKIILLNEKLKEEEKRIFYHDIVCRFIKVPLFK